MYYLIKEEGPTYHRLFTSEVILEDKVIAEGQGRTKKESEQKTTESAYHKLEDENK